MYRLFSQTDDLLYVGITNDPRGRFLSHRSDKSWWGNVFRASITTFPSWEEAAAAEIAAIVEETPKYNIRVDKQDVKPTGAPRAKAPKTHQDLPDEEIAFLHGLTSDVEVLTRSKELYDAGWSIRAILEGARITPASAWLVGHLWEGNGRSSGRPVPEFPITPTEHKVQTRKAAQSHRMRKQLTPAEEHTLRSLAPLVAKYRPSFSASHPNTLALQQYISLINDLKSRGVRTQEIADAAGVSESNIRRRLL